jgi:uncharacterized protein YdbL (DUF1318 family)
MTRLERQGRVQQLVSAENADRRRLYKEIARANGFPEKADEVQQIFADSGQGKHGSLLDFRRSDIIRTGMING